MNSLYIDVENALQIYNREPENRKLRDFYSGKTFFEIIGKGRNETMHSSFLAWLLDGRDLPDFGNDSQLMNFLDILVRRAGQQHIDWNKDAHFLAFRNAVLSRSVSLANIQAVPEKCVSDFVDDNLKKVIDPKKGKKDSVDLYISANVRGICEDISKLEIFIENKVYSPEGKWKDSGISQSRHDALLKEKGLSGMEYGQLTQTERYFWACQLNNKEKGVFRLFVYLKASSPRELDGMEQEAVCSNRKHYICINYQDVYDEVISPLLNSDELSDRTRFLLNEYIKSMSIPVTADLTEQDGSESDAATQVIMATTPDERIALNNYWGRNKRLIMAAVSALKSEDFEDKISQNEIARYEFIGEDGAVDCKEPLTSRAVLQKIWEMYAEDCCKDGKTGEEAIEQFNAFSYTTDKQARKYDIIDDNGELSCTGNKFQKVFSAALDEPALKKYVDRFAELKCDKKYYGLLMNFWSRNRNLILAALRVSGENDEISEDNKKALESVFKGLNGRDFSRYRVVFNNAIIGESLSKVGVIECLLSSLIWTGRQGKPNVGKANRKMSEWIPGKNTPQGWCCLSKDTTGSTCYKPITHNGTESGYCFYSTGWTMTGNFASLVNALESDGQYRIEKIDN